MTDAVTTKTEAGSALIATPEDSPATPRGKKPHPGKWRRWVAALLVLLLLGWVGHWGLNRYLQMRIRRGVEAAFCQKTFLGNASIQFIKQQLIIHDLQVANPEGFTDQDFLHLDQCTLDIQPASLLRNTVNIPEITIDGLKIVMEQNIVLNNVQEILTNIQEQNRISNPERGTLLAVGTVRLTHVTVVLRSQSLPGVKSKVSTVVLPELVLDLKNAQGISGRSLITMHELTLQILGRLAQEAAESKQVDGTWRLLLRPIASTLQAPANASETQGRSH